MSNKFANVRHWGQCAKCHRYKTLIHRRLAAHIESICDACFDVPMDAEAFDMIFEKAGVPGPNRCSEDQAAFNVALDHFFDDYVQTFGSMDT